MIYRNGKLISEINKNLSELIDTIEQEDIIKYSIVIILSSIINYYFILWLIM